MTHFPPLPFTPSPESDGSWEVDFPRLAELRVAALALSEDNFFQSLPDSVTRSRFARDAYRESESDLAALDPDAWRAFKSKALRCDLMPHDHVGYRGLCDVLNEAKGYRCLKHHLDTRGIDHNRITLIPERTTQTPEWAAYLGGAPVGAIEVKTIHESDYQSMFLAENMRSIDGIKQASARRLAPEIPDAFFPKLESTVVIARRQINSFAEGRKLLQVILLIIQFDHGPAQNPENYHAVASFLGGLSREDFIVSYQFRSVSVPSDT